MSGFKSFVDATEVPIEPGRSGVVGPNGCGKSNLVEALRWVMGETSPKNMRGTGMDDVIFAGTANRPARNMAEVTITLDNRERKAPAHFNEADTLEITRRIEREAGSVYRINGRDVRARDVQTLFADASTGAHSPALVRQGQIGELISAKPRNRRLLLEEAAGITGLHARRHEAELRLRAAETNLTRLQDLVQQMEGQLAGLRRQARQASRYRNLSGEIRRVEARLLAGRWQAAREALRRAEEEFAAAGTRVGALTEQAARASAAELKAAEALPPLREAEARAAAALHRLVVERDMLDAEMKRVAEDEARLARQLEQLAGDRAREAERLNDAEDAVARLGDEHALVAAEIANTAATRAAAETEGARQSEALGLAEAALEAATRQAADGAAARASLARALEDAARALARLSEEARVLAHQRQTLEAEASASMAIEPLRAGVEDARNDVTHCQAAVAAAEARRGVAELAEVGAREPLQAAERRWGTLKAEADAIAKFLGRGEPDLWPSVIDEITVEPGYEAALSGALGDDLNAPADRAAPVHWDDLGPLADSHFAQPLPAGAVPLAEFVRAPAALERRLSLVGVVDVETGKRLQALLRPGQRLVSREGHLWRWDGYTAASDAETAETKRLAQRNRLRELARELDEARAETDAARAHHGEAREGVEAAVQEERTARQALRVADETLARAREALAGAEKTAAAADARLAALAEAETRVARDRATQEEKRAEALTLEARVPAEATLRAALDQARDEAASRRLAAAEAQSAIDLLRGEDFQRRDREAALTRELKSWRERLGQARSQIETLDQRTANAEAERHALALRPAEIESRRGRLMDALSDAERVRGAAGDGLATAEALLKSAAQDARGAESALAEARETRARAEALRAGAEERTAEVAQRIRDTLDCTPDELAQQADLDGNDELPPLDDLERRLERLRREREALGGVNLRAEEEAQALDAEMATMVGEKTDLEGAIAKLRQGIAKLNAEGRGRLMEAFDTVNGHFQRLFAHLFGGGTAELKLVESDDPLEAGLEIFARPPGKRLQVMTLLSGGEQALTALALIFAVFLSNPAPICVLDEVDAPLDDANVERFCNLVDEMARLTETRFLVITHHPLTMARMDRLFGVTMAERGVSQLVAVDLATAQEVRAAS